MSQGSPTPMRHEDSQAFRSSFGNVVEGFDNLPHAVVGLYKTARSGKLQVRFEPRVQL
jgi:NADPH-dependent curcumin reductase CurA